MNNSENKTRIFFKGNEISKVNIGSRQLFPELEYRIKDKAELADVPDNGPIQVDIKQIMEYSKRQLKHVQIEGDSAFEQDEQLIQQLQDTIHQIFTQEELDQGLDYQQPTPASSWDGTVWYKTSIYEDWMNTDAIVDGETFVGFNGKNEAIDVILPYEKGTYIKQISREAFKDCKILKKIVLPS